MSPAELDSLVGLVRGARGDRAVDADVAASAVWTVLAEPGDGLAGRVIAAFGSAEALRALESDAAPEMVEAGEWVAARGRWMPRLRRADIERTLERAAQVGAVLITPGDDEWPARVDDLGEHAPFALWVRGDPGALASGRALSIVGARAATGYGEHVAAEIAAAVAADGTTIVSGAAYGIDGAAHRGALAAGGTTIALLAGGVDRAYPSGHARLLGDIAARGAVVSETPCGTAPTKWRFLARNRTIAALGDATVVVEAGTRSGSLDTAAHAAALGRPLGAVPGPVTSAASAGCHRMLREMDAICVTGADDARELAGYAPAGVLASTVDAGRTDDLTRVLDAASVRIGRSPEELARRSGLAVADVQALLGLAAIGGAVAHAPDGWRRTPAR